MIISINWIRKFVPNLPDIDELSRLIGARLVEIENIEDLGEKYKDVLIVKVISAHKVEGSDHLNLCKIDDGGVRQNVERDENGLIQVVCGAPNMRAGLFVAWLPPESIVPETFGGENFKLGTRKLMGCMSNGMIASLRELALGDEHNGILEIDKSVFENKLEAGESFAEKFELNDYLIEVENKSLTHRPDCFGILGFAREVAGILGQKFENPIWYNEKNIINLTGDDSGYNIEAQIVNSENSNICEKYCTAIMDISQIKASKSLTIDNTYLLRSGMRPVDALTDLTNSIMLETAQPLHAFDLDKLESIVGSKNIKITVRLGRDGEKILLLGGKEVNLSPRDIVIAVGENGGIPVALAGAMGGESTKVDENTKRILVESATFNLYNLRNTQMRHGIFSEAITRFTKGQPARACSPVLNEFIYRAEKMGAISLTSSLAEISPSLSQENDCTKKINTNKINEVLGSNFTEDKIHETLYNVGFTFNDGFIAPFWRTDIHIEEDLVEEVGRLNGYDNIKLSLPKRDFTAINLNRIDQIKQQIRETLVSAGANEVLTYSFIHSDLLAAVGQKDSNSYKIINSISPDLQFYRQTILPSILAKINQNIRAGYDEFVLFEMNKVTHKQLGLNEEGVPVERQKLALAYAHKKSENAFYTAKTYLTFLLDKLGVNAEFLPFSSEEFTLNPEFEPKRSAMIVVKDKQEYKIIGVIGEFKKSVSKKLKLQDCTAGFEVDVALLVKYASDKKSLKKFSRFQSVQRDLTISVDLTVSFGKILEYLQKQISTLSRDVNIEVVPLDIYHTQNNEQNVSFRFTITPLEKTLTGEEINQIIESVAQNIDKLGGKVI